MQARTKRHRLALAIGLWLIATALSVDAQNGLEARPTAPCLEYEPKVVALAGVVKRVVAPGPPNYESIARGDAKETIWVLHLERPVCVGADPANEANSAEPNVQELQLIVDYGAYRGLLGRRVTVTSQLTHATTGHHHTAVLLAVESMKLAPKASR